MKNSLLYSLSQVAGVFWVNLEKSMSEIGLHSGQLFLLSALWDADGQSQSELVKKLRVSPPTVYNMVVRMEKSGLVEIRKNERDARQMCVFLTPKGLDVRGEAEKQWIKLEESVFAELSETERRILHLILKKLNKD